MSEFKKIMKKIKAKKKILKEEEKRIKEEEKRINEEKEILKEEKERIKEEEKEILSRTIENNIIDFNKFDKNELIQKLTMEAKDEVFTKIIKKLREIVPQNNKYLEEYREYYGRYPSSLSPLPPSSCMYDNSSSSSCMYDNSSSSSSSSLKIPKSDLSALPIMPPWIKKVTSFHGPGIMENSIFLIKDEEDYFGCKSKNTSNNSHIELKFGLIIDNIFYYIRVSLSNRNVTIHSDIHNKYFI